MSTSSYSPPPPDPSSFYGERGHAENELFQPQDAGHTHPSPSVSVLTRTVAIIKTQALEQRLEIEPRILEANFEIVKERQMEFDTETDPETFYELFGDDARFLGDGPVWVYVLERRRATQVLLSLLPSLNNSVIGARTEAQAEMLIQALFASSPPFPATELPHVSDHDFDRGSIRSINSAVLEALQLGLETPLASSKALSPSPGSSDARAPAFAKFARSVSTIGSDSSSSKPQFRARPLPKTHVAPDITPRLTKAALLRQGLSADGSPRAEVKTRMSLASTGRIPTQRKDKENEEAEKEREKERARKTFAGVPGHKRVESIAVASTAPPAIAPRLTKAAALRLGLEQATLPPGRKRASISGPPPKASAFTNGGTRSAGPATPQKGSTSSANEADGEETETEVAAKKNTFEGVPGHKRRESFSVASTKAPTIAPRMNRSAALRKEAPPPPSSFMFRGGSVPKTPGSGMHSRSSSAMSAYRDSDSGQSWGRPRSTVPSRTASRAASRNSHVGASILSKSTSHSSQTSSSGTGTGPLSTTSTTSNESNEPSNGVGSPTRMLPRPTSLGAPTIAPRANKSALLRQQKQAADAAKPKSPWANASKR